MIYPDMPGHRRTDTSQEAADHAARRHRYVEGKILDCLAVHRDGLTPDECARLIGEHILTVRPAFTRLKQRRAIEDTGARRENVPSMRKAAVMRLKGQP